MTETIKTDENDLRLELECMIEDFCVRVVKQKNKSDVSIMGHGLKAILDNFICVADDLIDHVVVAANTTGGVLYSVEGGYDGREEGKAEDD